jgi:hypothetical protein
MKRIIIFAMALTSLVACNTNQAELEQLREENVKLKNEQGRNEEALFHFAETFNGIQSNLDSIAAKEGIITKLATTGEKSKPAHQQVNDQINSIYDMLLQNRKKLDQLSRQAKNLGQKNKDLELIIDRMNKQMEEKVVEVEMLRGQLVRMEYQISGLNIKVDSLNIVSETQKQLIEEQKTEIVEQKTKLNTVFYAIGTEKELVENHVISKEGGFIGIRKTGKISADLNTKYFEAVDKYTKKSFVLGSKKVKLVTPHPTGSYTLHGEKIIDSLTIENPDEFWKQSAYLVISIK